MLFDLIPTELFVYTDCGPPKSCTAMKMRHLFAFGLRSGRSSK